ncbi:MAG: sulfatase-like hydrolase/transferase, partial [Polyangiaceae bacterium]|nr:sulfatase-like hydrolase/transferase [Polyangiaceae bacterium]
GAFLAGFGRLIRRHRVEPEKAFGHFAGLFFGTLGLPIAIFRVKRDLFGDELALKSKEGLLVLLASVAVAVTLGTLISLTLRALARARGTAFLARAWGGPLVAFVTVLGFVGLASARPSTDMVASGRALSAAPADAKNVIVIVVDTLRADALGAYGYSKARTPNLDRFARDAVRYDRHFANASWTRPSFASIMTGRYPSNHGVMALQAPLPEEVKTIAEAFAEGGYYTSGIVTNTNVSPVYNFHQGFDEYAYLEPSFVLGANDLQSKLLVVQLMRRVIQRFVPVAPGSAYQDAETVNERVFTWLDRAKASTGENPFFLFVGYMDPHDPYFEHPYNTVAYDKASHQEPELSEAERLRELYDGEVAYFDEHFGRLIDDLRRRGLYDDTTIVVTSDHGEEFGEHGGFWHGVTLYDEQIRMPLFVKPAGGAHAGTVVRHFTQSVDLLPTLLAENGLAAVEGVQGGLLTTPSPHVFAEESHHDNVLRSLRVLDNGEEVKLITANAGNPRGVEERELYRVGSDPGERRNVATEEAATTARLETALDEAEAHYREGAARPAENVEMDCD